MGMSGYYTTVNTTSQVPNYQCMQTQTVTVPPTCVSDRQCTKANDYESSRQRAD